VKLDQVVPGARNAEDGGFETALRRAAVVAVALVAALGVAPEAAAQRASASATVQVSAVVISTYSTARFRRADEASAPSAAPAPNASRVSVAGLGTLEVSGAPGAAVRVAALPSDSPSDFGGVGSERGTAGRVGPAPAAEAGRTVRAVVEYVAN